MLPAPGPHTDPQGPAGRGGWSYRSYTSHRYGGIEKIPQAGGADPTDPTVGMGADPTHPTGRGGLILQIPQDGRGADPTDPHSQEGIE